MNAARDDLRRRLDTVESAYEFMLAYAAQGLPADGGARDGGRIRSELAALAAALGGLDDAFTAVLEGDAALAPGEAAVGAGEHREFHRVLAEDAAKALAAVRLVLAQRSISSQLVDNLNASSHLRALLTDVFLVDEILEILGSSIPAARSADPAGG
jgi:hypothetical protein